MDTVVKKIYIDSINNFEFDEINDIYEYQEEKCYKITNYDFNKTKNLTIAFNRCNLSIDLIKYNSIYIALFMFENTYNKNKNKITQGYFEINNII